ncbi:MAG: hypothetical protein C0481_04425 [Phenylobacterium sp.]|uniref:DUF1254 domain-containing protein n=1 Tax=Phenylobacterium sp. TaxID=1871053 RepID=UPI0025F46D13|nr:DUF1254 domain-containing protein [Phenylobacterium sp.]MBA4011092.1 hypothetical protein [Phenylobacterium sp.]
MPDTTPYVARQFNAAHPDLANSAGVPAKLANEAYVEALAKLVFYWGYPAVDTFGRTSSWEVMKAGPGATFGLFPGAPKNAMGYLDDYMSPAQRKVVTPNSDTIYGVSFADLTTEALVVQTPTEVPEGHYWTIQIVDLFTTVTHQVGSASGTPGGKLLVVGPDWQGEKPEGFIDVLRSPTNVTGLFGRSYTAHSPESKAQARKVLNQIGVYPLGQDQPGLRTFDCEASARNKVFTPPITPQMIAADPDMLRARPVHAATFWDDLKAALDFNPQVSSDDAPMADQARTLLALRASGPAWKALIDRVALVAEAELFESAKYHQVGVGAGGGWQRQENGGAWGTDWFGRAQAAVIYIYVNDFHEAIYFVRGTDAKGALLEGRYAYTLTFPKDGLPPVDRTRGGFWSLSMYDEDYYMLADSPNGRTNLGTVNLDANELVFAGDGSLTLTMSHREPADPTAKANWLPAPAGQFALLVRTYVPTQGLLDGTQQLPEVVRAG